MKPNITPFTATHCLNLGLPIFVQRKGDLYVDRRGNEYRPVDEPQSLPLVPARVEPMSDDKTMLEMMFEIATVKA